jgi:hypothetical protein
LKNWLGGKATDAEEKQEEEKKEDGVKNGKPKSQKAANLKERHGGEWAIIMESTADKTTK